MWDKHSWIIFFIERWIYAVCLKQDNDIKQSDSCPYFCMFANRLSRRINFQNFVEEATKDGTSRIKGSKDCEEDDKFSEVVGVYARIESVGLFFFAIGYCTSARPLFSWFI